MGSAFSTCKCCKNNEYAPVTDVRTRPVSQKDSDDEDIIGWKKFA